jgi:hypothetical protein
MGSFFPKDVEVPMASMVIATSEVILGGTLVSPPTRFDDPGERKLPLLVRLSDDASKSIVGTSIMTLGRQWGFRSCDLVLLGLAMFRNGCLYQKLHWPDTCHAYPYKTQPVIVSLRMLELHHISYTIAQLWQ